MTELPTSLRADGDTWEITESVGATALAVAAARAAETALPEPLVRDEYAYLLVSAAGPMWARLASCDPDWIDDDDAEGRRLHEVMRHYQATRTHFFDAYFTAAVKTGIRQIVILASGLDSRAYRLDWPAATDVFEIDQPKVLAFKGETLDNFGAVPNARRHPVAVDLRDDWPAALKAAGFDDTRPTAWLAEGLLPYLPADAQDRLFEMLTALSADGSQVAVEAFGDVDMTQHSEERQAAWRERLAQTRERLGLDMDVHTLMYHEHQRSDAAKWLSAHGWHVEVFDSQAEMARLGRAVPADLEENYFSTELLRARR